MKVPKIGGVEAFDEVLFDATSGGNYCGYVFMFDEVEDDFTEAGGNEVGGVAEEDRAACGGADGGGCVVGRFVFGEWLIGESPVSLGGRTY